MTNEWLPLLILSIAFLTGVSMFLIPEKSETLRTSVNLTSAALNIFFIGLMVTGVYEGESFETRLPLLPDINLVLHADALSLMFVTLSGVLWFFTTIYAIGYFKHGKHRSRFFGFFSLCVFSTLGIALAGNLITFLIFYELLTLATYPLIVHKGNEASLRSGKIYLRYTMIGGAVLMIAVVWLKSFAGALDFSTTTTLDTLSSIDPFILTVIFIMLIGGLGVKAAIFPLHSWLPRAMAAPAPVSSLLHAVAVVKAGAFGIIRVIYDVYGIELAGSLGVLYGLVILACITIIYASVRALFQDDIKKRLAYSTVSQVSYITLGVALAGPFAAVGALVHLVHQGLMKITMFFCAGNLAETHHIYSISKLDGIAKKMPITMTAFTIAILGMIGIPPLAGFVSKWYLGIGAVQTGYYWVQLVLIGSSLLNAMYFLPIVYRAWFKPLPDDPENNTKTSEAYWMMLVPPVVTISLAVAVGLFANSFLSPLNWAKLIAQAPEFGFTEVLRETAFDSAVFSQSLIPMMLILLPLTIAIIILFAKRITLIKWLLPLCSVFTIAFALFADDSVQITTWLFFGSELVLSNSNRSFLLLAGILWLFGSLYAGFYHHLGKQPSNFYAFFGVCMSASFGLVLSADMFGFITFFTIMSLSSYVLIILNQTPESRLAANNYIKWVIVGEVALFVAFCFLNGMLQNSHPEHSASLNNIVAIMLLVGFGIKMGLLGFHSWLPKAHPVAAIPASAMLSGFMVNAGVIGLLTFFQFESDNSKIGIVFVILGIIGTFYAAIKGFFQSNPKAILAYSTVSQMGIVAASFGVMLVYPTLRPEMSVAIIFYCMHHGLAKCALFLSVGIAGHLFSKSVTKYIAYTVIILPALALVGLPLLSGFIAKGELKQLLLEFPNVKYLFIASSTFTALLLLRFFSMLRLKAEESANNNPLSASDSALLLICSLNVIVMVVLPLHWYSADSLLPKSLMDAALSVAPAILAFLLYKMVSKRLNKPKVITSKTTINFDSVIAYIDTTGVSLKQLIKENFDRTIKAAFSERTSPRESTGETMQSSYVSLLIIVICLTCFLSLTVGS